MIVSRGGVILLCLFALPGSQTFAQGRNYPYAPQIPESSYPADVPPGYYPRSYVRRLPPGYHDDGDVVVIERRRNVYNGPESYPEQSYRRQYYRVVPGPYDDASPPRPYFRERDAGRAGTEDRGWEERARRAIEQDEEAAPRGRLGGTPRYSSLPPAAEQPADSRRSASLPPRLRRQIVEYRTKEPAGTIVVDTRNTYLYYVLGEGEAVRYGIGVGREGFTWSGTERISRMAEWPDWYPPKDMIERQPDLPRMMAGGPGNPLGARALYLGNTLYRIHGTNDPSTIGQFVSSGCIRLLNEDIEDLYNRVKVGTRVVVLSGKKPPASARARR
jgi:lipoprotein-anchoring transpeptidase ErfK/SrfK